MSETSIPAIPPIAPELLEEHHRERWAATRRLAELADGPSELFRFHGRRRLVEALANLFLDDRTMLLPPRRRHLHATLDRRVGGCSTALRHLDGRLEMVRRGHLDVVVGSETPYVLNAFAESHDPNEKETNPGLIRLTTSGFDVTQSSFRPPDGAHCTALLDACVRVANVAPVPAIVRAGWLASSFLAIHPFVDGNGRTARLLFQLVASSDAHARFDWSAVEYWAVERNSYIEALKASQAPSLPDYDGERVDVAPFVDFAIRSSIAGAQLTKRRATWFEQAWDELADAPDEARTAEIAVVAAASASLAELGELSALENQRRCTEVAAGLVAAGRLVWDRRGLLRPAAHNPLLHLPA